MKKLLKNTEFAAKDRHMICKAIERHNQKSKIHGVYDEVIKDADSFAHLDEGLIGEQDIIENYRVQVAKCKGIQFQVAPLEKWQAEAIQCLWQIEAMIKDEALYLNSPDQWVHSIRVVVRKMRSILGLIESVQKKAVTKLLRQFDNGLKEISKTLAETRFLQIACIKIGEAHPLYKELNDRLLGCYKTLENKNILLEHIEPTALYISTLSEMQYEPACMEKQVYKLIANYIKKADEVSLDNSKELHQLRIQGKKIKYLCQLELVAIEPEIFVNAVSSLHRLIGKYHDIVEIHLLLKASPFKNELELLEKEIWAECFLLKLIKTNFLDK
jgi:CHAD domain-containing protein